MRIKLACSTPLLPDLLQHKVRQTIQQITRNEFYSRTIETALCHAETSVSTSRILQFKRKLCFDSQYCLEWAFYWPEFSMSFNLDHIQNWVWNKIFEWIHLQKYSRPIALELQMKIIMGANTAQVPPPQYLEDSQIIPIVRYFWENKVN